MDLIGTLFDYQRFRKNAKLEARIDEVRARYLLGGTALPDEALELAAAGEPEAKKGGTTPYSATDGSDG